MNNEKGFTMIELIIVIGIMGILSAILVPSFAEMTRKSKFSADLNSVKYVQTQLEIYMAEHDGKFPGENNGDLPDTGSGISDAITVLAKEHYLKERDITKADKLDLQSKGVELGFINDGKVQNAALNVAGDENKKLKAIASGLAGTRDADWVLVDGMTINSK